MLIRLALVDIFGRHTDVEVVHIADTISGLRFSCVNARLRECPAITAGAAEGAPHQINHAVLPTATAL